ncbi:MAG: DUF4199 domain-containing protein [Cytophagaceae bacterium]
MKINFAYGLGAGILMATVDGLNYYYLYDTTFGKFAFFINLAILISAIFTGIKHISRQKFNGEIPYNQATLSGILISVYTGFILGAFNYIYFTFANQEYITYIIDVSREFMMQQEESPEAVQTRITELQTGFTPFKQAINSLKWTFILGLFISLISGIIVRKKSTQK